jgi:hypothetical protein
MSVSGLKTLCEEIESRGLGCVPVVWRGEDGCPVMADVFLDEDAFQEDDPSGDPNEAGAALVVTPFRDE